MPPSGLSIGPAPSQQRILHGLLCTGQFTEYIGLNYRMFCCLCALCKSSAPESKKLSLLLPHLFTGVKMVKNALAVGDPSGEAYIAPPADPLPRLTAGVHAYMCKEGERRGKKKEGGVWTAKLQLHYIRHCTWLHIFSTGMASLSFSSTLRRQCNFCIQGDTISQTLLPRK